MRVITVNTNGIRAAERKGFFNWFKKQEADFICIQETRAQVDQLEKLGKDIFWPQDYHCYYHDAEKKGYSGVAIYSRSLPDEVIVGLGWPDMDAEGRYLEIRLDNLSIVSLYLPSGSSSEERQSIKYSFLDRLTPILKQYLRSGRDTIICGDWNIAHKPIDLKNWRSNQKNSGFLPEERAWLDQLFDKLGWVDAFRVINSAAGQYTWWSNRGQAWANNTGWRIDYHIVSPSLKNKIQAASIYKEERFSDHAPLIIDYDYPV